MTTPNYDINYDDERFTQVNSDKQTALTDLENTYDGMISGSDKFYEDQIAASKEWADTQTKLQNENTDFTIKQIEQQKEQAEKDYTKEQSGAYVDWQKQSNKYGANAEQMAAQGLTNTGFSESSQVSMYNTYQNRVTTAREVFSRTKLNYDNAIKEAKLQNNAKLAEIAVEAQKTQLQLALEGFQYKNTLVLDKADKKRQLEQDYHNRWKDVLDQINKENSLAESVRQFDETAAETKRYHDATIAAQAAQLAEEKRQFDILHPAGGSSSGGSSSGGGTIIKGGSSSGGSNKSSGSKRSTSKMTKDEKVHHANDGKIKTSNNSTKSTNTKKSSPTVDMNSVLGLGYGPISESRLAELVASGKVVQYTDGNKIKFKKVFNG